MKLDRKSARRMIGQLVRKEIFPNGEPSDWEAVSRVIAGVAERASSARLEVLAKHVNQIVNGSAELVAPAIFNKVIDTLDLPQSIVCSLEHYHDVAINNPRTSFIRKPVTRAHVARRFSAHAMVRIRR